MCDRERWSRARFKHLGHYHITHRKFSRAPWSRKVSQKLDESQKFRESQLVLKSQILYYNFWYQLSGAVFKGAKRMIKRSQPPYPARWWIIHSSRKVKSSFITNITYELTFVGLHSCHVCPDKIKSYLIGVRQTQNPSSTNISEFILFFETSSNYIQLKLKIVR